MKSCSIKSFWITYDEKEEKYYTEIDKGYCCINYPHTDVVFSDNGDIAFPIAIKVYDDNGNMANDYSLTPNRESE